MRFACISASNTRLAGGYSTSIEVCNRVKSFLKDELGDDTSVDLIALRDYDIKACILCGECSRDSQCIYDQDFNKLFHLLEEVQGIFLVVPHYSPIPAKLVMILEKINEITYAGWLKNGLYYSPFSNKKVGIIGHGGRVETEDTLLYYHDRLVTPIADTLKALSFRIVGQNENFPHGAVFGLKEDDCLRKSEQSIFPDIIQDWSMIEERIKPLIHNMIKAVRMEE